VGSLPGFREAGIPARTDRGLPPVTRIPAMVRVKARGRQRRPGVLSSAG